MVQLKIKYAVLSEALIEKRSLIDLVKDTFNFSESHYNFHAKQKVDRFIKSHDLKFKKESHFKHNVFLLKNKEWLERELLFDCEVFENQVETEPNPLDSVSVDIENQVVFDEQVALETDNQERDPIVCVKRRNVLTSDYRSRKRRRVIKDDRNRNKSTLKPFDQCSRRTRRRRCEKIRSEMSEAQMNAIYLSYLRTNDRKEEAKIVEKLRSASPNRRAKILAVLNDDTDILPYTPDEALVLMVDTNLSVYQYNIIQHQAKSRNANIYPPYNRVLESKKMCYPMNESISVSETGANIVLQSLLDHTSARLVHSFEKGTTVKCSELKVYYKWGFDGASGQSEYKQVFNRADSTDKSDLMTSLVPLQVRAGAVVLWQNPTPSSTRYCRPIAFEFTKETRESNIELWNFVKNQIKLLGPTALVLNGKDVRATHDLQLTMVDGKVVDHLTDTNMSNCNICGAKPNQMNVFENLKKLTINENNFQFGLSTLHCWIRFLECLLHIAFKMPIKRTDARASDKAIVMKRKAEIQNAFKQQTGLLLDFVKPGAGTTNDGNSARRFFENPKLSAEITGLDESLIDRFRVILICLSSGRAIDTEKFGRYASETADRYHALYSWYKMPPSVHKVLFHGSHIIDSLNLPIGLYSEEAQEARNKDFKNIRQHHTRKMSRVDTNEDLLHGLLVSSDPVISSLRTPFPKPKQELDPDILQLLEIE